MKRYVLLAIAVGCVACSKLPEEKVPAFVMETFALESNPGCVSDTVACATFKVDYPKFTHLDSAVQQSLMGRITYWLSGGLDEEPKTLAVLGNDFIRDFDQFLADMPGYGLGWTYKASVQVLVASDTLISLQVNVESFTGGAHGSYATNFVNIDPKTGTAYLLDAFLRPGYQPVLKELGERDFRLQRELDEATSLEDAGFHFPENQFSLNDNYGFRKEGIVFFFNSYEIAAYSEGPTEILIPYEALGGWYRNE